MLNISVKIGEAKERMILKTRKSTLSLDRRTRSARASSKGASAKFSGGLGSDDTGGLGTEGDMTGELEDTVLVGDMLRVPIDNSSALQGRPRVLDHGAPALNV